MSSSTRPGSVTSTPDAHRWQVSRQTPTRSGRPRASMTRSISSRPTPMVPPAPGGVLDHELRRRSRDRPRRSTPDIASVTCGRTASRPRPRWLPRWKTTPSASIASAAAMVSREGLHGLRVHLAVGRAQVDQVGGVTYDDGDAGRLAGGPEPCGGLGIDGGMPPHTRALREDLQRGGADRAGALERLVCAPGHAEMGSVVHPPMVVGGDKPSGWRVSTPRAWPPCPLLGLTTIGGAAAANRRLASSSVAPIPNRYERSLRPCDAWFSPPRASRGVETNHLD